MRRLFCLLCFVYIDVLFLVVCGVWRLLFGALFAVCCLLWLAFRVVRFVLCVVCSLVFHTSCVYRMRKIPMASFACSPRVRGMLFLFVLPRLCFVCLGSSALPPLCVVCVCVHCCALFVLRGLRCVRESGVVFCVHADRVLRVVWRVLCGVYVCRVSCAFCVLLRIWCPS